MSDADLDPVLERVLQSVGDEGRYQKLLFWLFLVPLHFIIPSMMLVQIFQSSLPDHWCHVPGKPESFSSEEWKNMTIPWTTNSEEIMIHSKCQQFTLWDDSDNEVNITQVTDCQNGWDFNHTSYERTLPMDQEWVCEKEANTAKWFSANLAGKVVGTFIFCSLSDFAGRKMVTVITSQIYAVFGIVRLFVKSEWVLLGTMFISGMSFPALLEISLIYVVEQVSRDMRAQVPTASFVMWTFGMALLPLLAWLTKDWVILGLVTSLPFFPFLAIWWLIPESPRWLISKGRKKEAFEALKFIAGVNGKEPPKDLDQLKICSDSNASKNIFSSSLGFIDLFKFPVSRKRLLMLCSCFSCNVIMYYGITYNTTNVSGNEFLNFFYLSITELPGNILGLYCADKFGRRYSESGFFLMSAITACITSFILSLNSWVGILLLAICKTFVTATFLVVYIQIAELLPTSHRGSGSGFISIISCIVGILVPYIAYADKYWSALPYLIITLTGVIGTIISIFLPETLGTILPQTIQEAENHLINQPFWSYQGWRPNRKRKYEATSREEDVL